MKAFGAVALVALSLHCASTELPLPPRPDAGLVHPPPRNAASSSAAAPEPAPDAGPAPAPDAGPAPAPDADAGPTPSNSAISVRPIPAHCTSTPPLGPDGAVPPAPPHVPLGEDVPVPGDSPAYVLPGNAADARVIVYLHGMCGDVAAADYFREAVRAHGTLIALRGDTPCAGDRFKWRADPSQIFTRLQSALKQVAAHYQLPLTLQGAVLFGYSQGADRAEKLAAQYPQRFRRVVLGGPPMKASPLKLSGAARVAILGGELETTENMRIGFDALQAAGISSRFFTLECAYHGYYGTSAEQQLGEVLDWVSSP